MMRKYLSLFLLMILSLTSVVSVSAAAGTPVAVPMTVGIPNYFLVEADETKTPIDAPSSGKVETSVTVSNYGSGEPTVTLIVAVITKATGALHDIGCDIQTISNGQVTLAAAAELPDTTDYTYRYMVWDNFTNMIALGNSAPLAPESLASTDVSTSTVSLAWTPAEDDVEAVSYKVFRDDVEIGTTPTPAYTDTGLDENTTYSYKVVAIDGLGEVSTASQALSVKTNRIVRMSMGGYTRTGNIGSSSYPFSQSVEGGLLSSAAFDTIKDGEAVGSAGYLYVEGGLANETVPTANSYSFENYVNADNSETPCVTTYNLTTNYGLRFFLDEGFISPTDKKVSFIVKYLDNFDSNKYIQISYVGENGKKVSNWSNAIQGGNTGEWKEAIFTVTDAALSGNPSFCIRPYNIENIVYISEVGIAKNYVPK